MPIERKKRASTLGEFITSRFVPTIFYTNHILCKIISAMPRLKEWFLVFVGGIVDGGARQPSARLVQEVPRIPVYGPGSGSVKLMASTSGFRPCFLGPSKDQVRFLKFVT